MRQWRTVVTCRGLFQVALGMAVLLLLGLEEASARRPVAQTLLAEGEDLARQGRRAEAVRVLRDAQALGYDEGDLGAMIGAARWLGWLGDYWAADQALGNVMARGYDSRNCPALYWGAGAMEEVARRVPNDNGDSDRHYRRQGLLSYARRSRQLLQELEDNQQCDARRTVVGTGYKAGSGGGRDDARRTELAALRKKLVTIRNDNLRLTDALKCFEEGRRKYPNYWLDCNGNWMMKSRDVVIQETKDSMARNIRTFEATEQRMASLGARL
jgi:tetratricopeptide (TPR) repeat protein